MTAKEAATLYEQATHHTDRGGTVDHLYERANMAALLAIAQAAERLAVSMEELVVRLRTLSK